MELCNVFSKCVLDFKEYHDKKINFTSWKIQESILQISADNIRLTIIRKIVTTGFFAIMIDEARYI